MCASKMAALVAGALSIWPMTSFAESPAKRAPRPAVLWDRGRDSDSVLLKKRGTYITLELGRRDGTAMVIVQGWRVSSPDRRAGHGRANIGDRVFCSGYLHTDQITGEVAFSHATDVLIWDLAPDRAPTQSNVSAMHRSAWKYKTVGPLTELTFSLEGGFRYNIAAPPGTQVVLDAYAGVDRAVLSYGEWGPTFSTHLSVDAW